MATFVALKQAQDYLHDVLSHIGNDSSHPDRPHVTLTYAQSLDGKIAGVGGTQLALSCPESFVMTHWMRTMHDGIMVGVGTAINDNPGLAPNRLPPRQEPYPAPTPIILDSQLRLPVDAKIIKQHANGAGRQPWILCGPNADLGKREALEAGGAKVVAVALDPHTGRLSLPLMLTQLKALGIRSLMVEGGREVISAFLAASTEHDLLDAVILTVAPMWVGAAGVSAMLEDQQPPKLGHIKSEVMGIDTIVTCGIVRN